MKVFVLIDLTEGDTLGVFPTRTKALSSAHLYAAAGMECEHEISEFVENETSIEEFELELLDPQSIPFTEPLPNSGERAAIDNDWGSGWGHRV